MQAALDGAGLAWGRACLGLGKTGSRNTASGVLVPVLEDWCLPFPGFFLYSRAGDSSPRRWRH